MYAHCSAHASVPYEHAEGIQNEHLKNGKIDVHAEHARKELMLPIVRVRITSLHAQSEQTSVFDPYAQRMHKGQSIRERKSKVLIKVPKTAKIKKKITNKWS